MKTVFYLFPNLFSVMTHCAIYSNHSSKPHQAKFWRKNSKFDKFIFFFLAGQKLLQARDSNRNQICYVHKFKLDVTFSGKKNSSSLKVKKTLIIWKPFIWPTKGKFFPKKNDQLIDKCIRFCQRKYQNSLLKVWT